MKTKKTYLLLLLFTFTSIITQAQWASVAVFLEQGTLDKAKEALDKAWEKSKSKEEAGKLKNPNKTWSEANFYKGEVYARLANDQTGIFSKDYPDAVITAYEAYQKAVEFDKDGKGRGEDAKKSMKDYLWNGGINYGAKQFELANKLEGDEKTEGLRKAMQGFNIARLVKDDDTLGTMYATDLAYMIKDYEMFEETVQEVLELDVENKTRYFLTYAFYLRDNKKDDEKALEVTKAGVEKGNSELDPENYATLEQLQIELMQKLGKTEDAMQALEAAIKSNPNEYKNFVNLGLLYQRIGENNANEGEKEKAIENYARAEELYTKVLELEDNNFTALIGLATIHYNRGADIQKEVNNWDVTTYNKKGRDVEVKIKGHYEKALVYMEKTMAHEDYNKGLEDALNTIKTKLKK